MTRSGPGWNEGRSRGVITSQTGALMWMFLPQKSFLKGGGGGGVLVCMRNQPFKVNQILRK